MKQVLVFTSLFPNATDPELGSFIKKRMAAYHKKENRKIVVLAPVPYFPPIRGFPEYYRFSCIPAKEMIDTIPVYHPRYPLIPKISMAFHGWLMYLFALPLVRKLHRQHHFHIIDAHFVYPDGMAAGLLAKKLHLPFAVSARGSDIAEFLEYPGIRSQILKTLTDAHAIISVSQGLKQLMTSAGVPSEAIRVIPNGIDPKKFYEKDRQAARNALGIDPCDPVILSVASLIPIKGHDLTIKAVHAILKKFPDLSLYIIGKGPEKKAIEHLIQELHLEKHVHLMGQIPNEQLLDWYNAADVFCLASAREGWPNVLTEALCCGTPCVGSRIDGISELISHQKNGMLTKRNVPCLAESLETALTTSWNKNKISREMSSRTWDKVAEEVDETLMQAIKIYQKQSPEK